MVLRVGLDATPLLGPRTGVGRYVERVSATMSGFEDAPEQVWTFFSRRGQLALDLPPRVELARRAVPARILHPLWRRFRRPTAEFLAGPLDVFHGGNFQLPPTRRAARVVTVHDLTFRFFPKTVHPAMLPVLSRLPDQLGGADAVITVSHAVADEIVAELGLPRERIVVAQNGVDPSWAEAVPLTPPARGALGLPDRYFFFLGTMEPRKNLPTLLAAYAAARRQQPGLPELAVAGGSGWGEEIRSADGVHTLGYLEDAVAQALVAGSVAVCSPSRYEGFGLPVLEGLAAGRPVLASDIAAHREVAGGQAELIPTLDVDAWSQALLRAAEQADDPAAAQRRRAVAAGFSWQASARVHLDLYRTLAGR